MSVRSKILAAATVMAMAGGVVAASAGTASAATPSCGGSCVNIYTAMTEGGSSGPLTYHPHFVLDSFKRGTSVGTPVILFRASNSDPGQDFVISEQGTMNDFYDAGLVSSALELHYGCVAGSPAGRVCTGQETNNEAYEIEYAPYGADTGLCVGVGSVAVNGTKVSLQPCGVSSKTTWIDDTYGTSLLTDYVAAINGSGANFSDPYVLTYPQSSYPTDSPRPQLFTQQRAQFSGTTVVDYQQFSGFYGVLP